MKELLKSIKGIKLRKSKAVISAILVFLVFESAFGEEKDILASLTEHLSVAVSSPFNIKNEDLPVVLLTTVIGGAVYLKDEEISDLFRINKSGICDIAANIDIFGDGYMTLGGSAVLYLAGGEKEKNVAVKVLESFIETGLISTGFKCLAGRNRPP
ncbi:MAG: hypothetical protein WCI43_06420, partial [Candidatus Firestonebacteria bacterium]